MDLKTFQERALNTDRTNANYGGAPQKDVVVALLGVAGELGTLASTYKKYLRDGAAYKMSTAQLGEEIGDLLWYLAVLASKFNLDLSAVAAENLKKTDDRWGTSLLQVVQYDKSAPLQEQFPRAFDIDFISVKVGQVSKIAMQMAGQQLGDPLTDNAGVADNYRFHDAFHLAFAAVLGWSPVLRKLMRRKRKYDSGIDEVQDGGRAIVIEEGIAALVFDYGVAHDRLMSAETIDYDLLKTIKGMVRNLEVASQPARAWEMAIQQGWKVFRGLSDHGPARVSCNLDSRTIALTGGL